MIKGNVMKEDAREKIYRAAGALLDEAGDPDRISTRQIAGRAGVGTGLINYHFQSKDKLLHAVISDRMSAMALELQSGRPAGPADPLERLESMLISLSDYTIRYEKSMQAAISFELQQGKVQTPLYIVPLLMDIFPERDEMLLRMSAFQLITTLQAVALRPSAFADYAGVNMRDKVQRDRFIRTLIRSSLNIE